MKNLKFTPKALLAGATIALMAFVGACSSGSDQEAPEAGSEPGTSESTDTENADDSGSNDDSDSNDDTEFKGEATYTIGDIEFDLALEHCGVFGKEDGLEILFGGDAETKDGLRGWLMASTEVKGTQRYGEMLMSLNVMGQEDRSGEYYVIENLDQGEFEMTTSGDGYIFKAPASNEKGEDLGEGVVAMTCYKYPAKG